MNMIETQQEADVCPTHVFYKPGNYTALDEVHPITRKGVWSGLSLEQFKSADAGVVLVTKEEAMRLIDLAATTAPETISQDVWEDALESLPPQKWIRRGDSESFQFLEMYAGNVTTMYVRVGRSYWRWRDVMSTDHQVLVEKARAAVNTKADR